MGMDRNEEGWRVSFAVTADFVDLVVRQMFADKLDPENRLGIGPAFVHGARKEPREIFRHILGLALDGAENHARAAIVLALGRTMASAPVVIQPKI
jgi:hypothetical protein